MSMLDKLKDKPVELLTSLDIVILSESNFALQNAAADELAVLKEKAEHPHCPSCGTLLSSCEGYWWCPNDDCEQSAEPWTNERGDK